MSGEHSVNCELQVGWDGASYSVSIGGISFFKMVIQTMTLQTVHGHVLGLALSLGPCFGWLTSVRAVPVVEK